MAEQPQRGLCKSVDAAWGGGRARSQMQVPPASRPSGCPVRSRKTLHVPSARTCSGPCLPVHQGHFPPHHDHQTLGLAVFSWLFTDPLWSSVPSLDGLDLMAHFFTHLLPKDPMPHTLLPYRNLLAHQRTLVQPASSFSSSPPGRPRAAGGNGTNL